MALFAVAAHDPARDSASGPSDAANAFMENCLAAGQLLPDNVELTHAEAVDPAPEWRSPASLTSASGEAVRLPFCRLVGTIDGDIGFEIWLPRDWNNRILGAGVGGEAGYFNFVDMARGVEQGFVTASSDTGHKRGEPWIDDPRKSENYAHIAYHRLTEVTKAIARNFYGEAAAYSYFLGCSGGGRQGLRELQLYPGDYDGALIGAPGLDVPLLAARFIQVELAQTATPNSALSAADWDLVARSAVAECDPQDGLTDGVIADPRRCGFRVSQIACRPGSSDGCLSTEKVRAAEAIIAPLMDSTGKAYDYGLLPGITTRPGGMPPLPAQLFGGIVHNDPSWDPRSFDIASDLPAARAAFATMDASSANLTDFVSRGGKLMLYHGWVDASVQPESTIDFYARLAQETEGARADYARLYMVPGMQHCRGGSGTDHFGGSEDRHVTADPAADMLAALIAWVERDIAPQTIEARRLGPDGRPDRTRPLCAFPGEATYRGSGNAEAASNFFCSSPSAEAARHTQTHASSFVSPAVFARNPQNQEDRIQTTN